MVREEEKPWGLPAVSVSLAEVPLSIAAADVAEAAGVSVAVPEAVGKTLVSVNANNQDAERVFRTLAASANVSVQWDGSLVRFREAIIGGVVVLVPASYDDPSTLVEAFKGIVGEGGSVHIAGDRIIVRADEGGVARVRALASQLSVGPDGWLLDVRVLQASTSLREDLGVAFRASGTGRLDLRSAISPAFLLSGAGAIEAIFSAVRDSSEASLLTSGTLYVLEGREASMAHGDRIPVPVRTVSPQGTVTTNGFTFIDAGFELKVKCRRVPQGLLLDITPTLGSVSGYVEGVPIVSRRTITASVVVASGELIMVSGLEAAEASEAKAGLPGMVGRVTPNSSKVSKDQRAIVVLVHARRVFAAGGGQ